LFDSFGEQGRGASNIAACFGNGMCSVASWTPGLANLREHRTTEPFDTSYRAERSDRAALRESCSGALLW
jgi:hypothetical protein